MRRRRRRVDARCRSAAGTPTAPPARPAAPAPPPAEVEDVRGRPRSAATRRASCTRPCRSSTGAVSVAAQREVGVDDRAEAFRVAQPHPLADRGQAERRPSAKPFRPMRPPNVHLAAAEPRRRRRRAGCRCASNETRAVDRLERSAAAKVPDPAVGDAWRCRRTRGLSSGPLICACSAAVPRLRMSRKKPCRMPRLASPVASTASVVGVERRPARRAAARCPRRPAAAGRSRARAGSSDSSIGPSLRQRVVEQLQVELLDARARRPDDRCWRARRRRGSCRWRPRW